MQNDSNKPASICLIKFGLIYKIIKKISDKPYKKSCFVIQGYNNIKKTAFLTQLLTIQQYSKYLLLSVAPTL